MQLTKNRKNKFGSEKTKQVFRKTNGHCFYCGIQIKPPISGDGVKKVSEEYKKIMFTMEHRKPKSEGGTNHIYNLVPSCRSCNNLRGSESESFLRHRLLFIQNGWPKFNSNQFNFLIRKGIDISILGEYKFYFEKKGLS